MADSSRVVAAVDFGTHGTGFAWSLRNDPKHTVFYYDQWPGQPAAYPKNLSALLLDADGMVVAWGYEARRRRLADATDENLDYRAHFKIALLPDGAANGDGDRRKSEPSAIELTALCLREVYRVAIKEIVTRTAITPDEVEWLLTVPAIWGDRERHLMRTAAEIAGFSGVRLSLVTEPEAAALDCWQDPAFEDLAQPGRRFVVVDAGSGTVDITSYEVVGTDDRPRLAGLGVPTGAALGAGDLDREFIRGIVRARLGQALAWEMAADGASRIALLDDWERAKRDFDPRRGGPLNVTLPPKVLRKLYVEDDRSRAALAAAQGGVDDSIVLSPGEVRSLFDKTITPMIALVAEHIRALPRGTPPSLLLVGGFAQSHYLQDRFRQAFSGIVTQVLTAPRPAHAVLFGAVRSGLEGVVVSRPSQFTYGIAVRRRFHEHSDQLRRMHIDEDGDLWCEDAFAVLVTMGQQVVVGHEISQQFCPSDSDTASLGIRLFQTKNPRPRYIDEPGSEHLLTIDIDIRGTVGEPIAKRKITVTLVFGLVELAMRVLDRNTGVEQRASMNYLIEEAAE
ncbi:Hsp70 protein [Nocardia tenerifensis]|uniref:Hsp70 protein n=1 Tax=Nocardia tenerifensis TaxID=228006 RepID=A0A318KFE3_9NOCA|nr:Hsp70 family protein [Nocardia tenerifensis]PXX71685.1 Hsp70 protein [Nocardia tenerifensis]